MLDIIEREFTYVSYYFMVQLRQIFIYWVLGMVIGSLISVFAKDAIHSLFAGLKDKRMGLLGVVPASILHDHRTRDQDHQSGSPEDRAGDTAFSALSGLCYGIFTVDWNDSESGCLDH